MHVLGFPKVAVSHMRFSYEKICGIEFPWNKVWCPYWRGDLKGVTLQRKPDL